MLHEFAGFYYSADAKKDTVREIGVCITANTKEEALGLLLDKFPDTEATNWLIVGGETNNKHGYVDIQTDKSSSYWED